VRPGWVAPGSVQCQGIWRFGRGLGVMLVAEGWWGVYKARRRGLRRGARVADRGGLENRCACERTVGSNPTLSARVSKASNPHTHSHFPDHAAVAA
jgi:hypothetical protein